MPATQERISDVLAWRLCTLAAAGYEDDAAVALALANDVDLHDAARLLKLGCPPDLAVRILL
jgi:hypothetical protein